KELRNFGANFVLRAGKKPVTDEEIKKLDKDPFSDIVSAYAPLKVAKLKKGFKDYKIVGTNFKALKELRPWLKISTLNLKKNDVLVGQDLASQLNLKKGDQVKFSSYISYPQKSLQKTDCTSCHKEISESEHEGQEKKDAKAGDCLEECHDAHEQRKRREHKLAVVGTISSGGDEDNNLFTNSKTLFSIAKNKGYESVDLSVLSSKIGEKDFKKMIENNFGGAKLESIKQISVAEKSLLSKVMLFMILLTVVVLMTCSLSVASTLSGIVMERRTEIGLMKAIGASHANISTMFIAELSIMALTAGILGYFGGFVLALLLAKVIFKTVLSPNLIIMLISVISSLLLVGMSSLAPVTGALRIQPVQTLRGE
ncbi:MAG: FtsX-like permease family protein, partial [Actinobacteria bacterium]